jgi:hypothetical protein
MKRYLKITQHRKRAGRVAQLVPSECEALSLGNIIDSSTMALSTLGEKRLAKPRTQCLHVVRTP